MDGQIVVVALVTFIVGLVFGVLIRPALVNETERLKEHVVYETTDIKLHVTAEIQKLRDELPRITISRPS